MQVARRGHPAMLIGIDTGGTYTDAVIFSAAEGVLAKAKALTTKHDLSIGIGEANNAAMETANVLSRDVAMISMSTTLATNAIVEGNNPDAHDQIGRDRRRSTGRAP